VYATGAANFGEAGDPPTGSPHSAQNFAADVSAAPHFAQPTDRPAPHSGQNFARSGVSVRQRGHIIGD
jgi:hypothetical protein